MTTGAAVMTDIDRRTITPQQHLMLGRLYLGHEWAAFCDSPDILRGTRAYYRPGHKVTRHSLMRRGLIEYVENAHGSYDVEITALGRATVEARKLYV